MLGIIYTKTKINYIINLRPETFRAQNAVGYWILRINKSLFSTVPIIIGAHIILESNSSRQHFAKITEWRFALDKQYYNQEAQDAFGQDFDDLDENQKAEIIQEVGIETMMTLDDLNDN